MYNFRPDITGKNIKWHREHKGWTVDQLALAIGHPREIVKAYEAGHCLMMVDTIFNIANALEADPAWIINYEAVR